MSQDFSHVIQTTKNGRLDLNSDLAHVTGVVERAIASGRPIVLQLHGGLVGKESAYKMVNKLQIKYAAEGLHPIFIVWRTGIFDALKNVDEIARKPLFQKLLVRLLKYFVAKAGLPGKGAVGIGEEPDDAEIAAELKKLEKGQVPYTDITNVTESEELSSTEEQYLEQQFQTDNDLVRAFSAEVEQADALSAFPKLDADVVKEAKAEQEDSGKGLVPVTLAVHAVKIAARIVKRYYNHTDHRLHATIVEEILRELFFDEVGTVVWGFMKGDAAETFEQDGQAPERGGWLFLKLLDAGFRALEAAGKPLPPFSIVGHSAGAIFASNLVLYLEKRRQQSGHWLEGSPLRVHKLVFLAPACRHTLFDAVVQHPAKPLFTDFRMYCLTDDHELGYFEVPGIYPGSLLYLLSGLFEDDEFNGESDRPLVGMHRYYRTSHPYDDVVVKRVGAYLTAGVDRLILSSDPRCDSRRHGEFDDTDATIASFIQFVKN